MTETPKPFRTDLKLLRSAWGAGTILLICTAAIALGVPALFNMHDTFAAIAGMALLGLSVSVAFLTIRARWRAHIKTGDDE